MTDKQKRFEYLKNKHQKFYDEGYFLGFCPKYKEKHKEELKEVFNLLLELDPDNILAGAKQ